MNAKAKGSRAERRAKAQLESEGYYCIKAGGSLGLWDIVALRSDGVRLVQVKHGRIGLAERERLEAFNNYPPGTRKEVWVFHDRQRDPIVGIL